MKKVWSLEKATTQEDIDRQHQMVRYIESHDFLKDEDRKALHDFENSMKVGDWYPFFVTNNYYKFCGQVKKRLKDEDHHAIKLLKEEIGKTAFTPEINAKFREAHLSVFNSYRVVEGEIEDNATDVYKYKTIKVNGGVYKYLWGSK